MTRCVFDANVVVSALLFSASPPGRAFFRSLEEGAILVSVPLLKELNRVLGRDKFNRYVSREERDGFIDSLLRESPVVDIVEPVRACRDPKDDHILELAVNGDASFIITGDADLLVLNPFRGIRILSPSEFLRTVEG